MSLNSRFIDVTNPMLQVFSPQEKDSSIIDYEYIQRFNQDGSDIQNIEKPLYEFVVTDRDAWMNLSESFIEARVSIVRSDTGAAITAGNIALVNNGFNLFKRAEYQYDGKGVLETVEYPGHKAQIMGLINNSQDSEKALTNEFWYPDRSGSLTIPIEVRNTTAGARLGQRLQISGTGANPHIINVAPYPASGSANLVAGDTIGLYYNGIKLTVLVNGVVTELVSAAGGAAAVITNVPNNSVVRFFYYDKEVSLKTEGGIVSSFSGNATPNMVFVNGTANATTLDDTIVDDSATAFKTRRDKFRNAITGTYDKVATIYLPLRKLFGFFDYNRVILKGATHKLSLYRNDVGRALFRDAGAVDGKIKFWV